MFFVTVLQTGVIQLMINDVFKLQLLTKNIYLINSHKRHLQ